MDLVYQEIWNADQAGNGVPALRPNDAQDKNAGYVVVDERATGVSSDHRILGDVHIPDSKSESYALCSRLMDNYALERHAREIVRPEEVQEELDFIDFMLDTPPVQVAQDILQQRMDLNISKDMLAALIRETWFEIGPAGGQEEASGFEHVFVGEQARKASGIGGYHYWHKYWLDDGGNGSDGISYHGTKYGGAQFPDQGVLVPEIVTLSMSWDAPAGDGGSARRLSKPIGGFFVGCSPEGLMALGLVRSRTPSSKITNINGAEYQLDLHRLDNGRGIRTFFPRFRRADVVAIDPGPEPDPQPAPIPAPIPPEHAPAPFRVLAAMVNAVNPEGGREFLHIINTTDGPADLGGWRVVAPNGTRFTLDAQSLAPGEIFRFVIPGTQGALRNRGGTIELLDPTGATVQRCTYSEEEGSVEGRVILF